MATGSGSKQSGNPAEQAMSSMKAVTDALQRAAQMVAANSQEVGSVALRQAQQNTEQLFDTLRSMAETKDPNTIYKLYTNFLTDSAQKHAEQLVEMGTLLAKTGQAAWQPVTSALAQAKPPKGE